MRFWNAVSVDTHGIKKKRPLVLQESRSLKFRVPFTRGRQKQEHPMTRDAFERWKDRSRVRYLTIQEVEKKTL